MSLDNNFKISKNGSSYILYDDSIITEPTLQLFDRDYHINQLSQQNKSASQPSGGVGRARVAYFSLHEKSFVLKHYYRGGAVASLLKDRYFGVSIVKSRAFREFRLLKKMQSLGLPVPVAAAAHVRKGMLFYRADLITEEIINAKTLSDILSMDALDDDGWQKIGRCVKQFHLQNIYHADLNARNILLTQDAEIHLIDFDDSYIRLGTGSWKIANLARLKRSLLKFKNSTEDFRFDEDCWSAMLRGYKAEITEQDSAPTCI